MISKPILKLINSYYFRGFFGPFFGVIFPVILIFILGNAFYKNPQNPTGFEDINLKMERLRILVAGVLVTSIIASGIFGIPIMIVEFKKSTIMKRIGAAKISKASFLFTVLFYQFLWTIFSFVWVLLWGGITLGTKADLNWTVAFSPHIGLGIVFVLFAFILSLSLGILIVAIAKTAQAVYGITNTIYLPISFFSGSFIPKNNIDSSSTLNIISYMVPTKYVVDPFFAAWTHGASGLKDLGWESYGYPIIAIVLIVMMLAIAIKKFKWN